MHDVTKRIQKYDILDHSSSYTPELDFDQNFVNETFQADKTFISRHFCWYR